MKKLLLLALLAMIMVGCMEHYGETKINSDYSIRVIDSCEYIVLNGVGVKAHKGNCRFCAERNRRMIREQVDSILTEIYD